jgi:hypothetical protein
MRFKGGESARSELLGSTKQQILIHLHHLLGSAVTTRTIHASFRIDLTLHFTTISDISTNTPAHDTNTDTIESLRRELEDYLCDMVPEPPGRLVRPCGHGEFRTDPSANNALRRGHSRPTRSIRIHWSECGHRSCLYILEYRTEGRAGP